jgi:hypothetical protein
MFRLDRQIVSFYKNVMKLSHNRGSFFLLIYFLFYWASYSILLSDNQTDEHQF